MSDLLVSYLSDLYRRRINDIYAGTKVCQTEYIRVLYRCGMQQHEIAEEVCLSKQRISTIVKDK